MPEAIHTYSIKELNSAIGNLLERGFAPKFLLQATVYKSQLKKGHLWLSLTDGEASITAVAWSSILQKINFIPEEDDGVLILGKLNFWNARATLSVHILDIRPNISTVLKKFEIVKDRLIAQGLIDDSKKRQLPIFPKTIAILTSFPSSAYADMIKTARERWPITKLLIVPIPVQGSVENKIQKVISDLEFSYKRLGLDALVLARGGGSREDLILFDNEGICRALAHFPVPVVTGIGHEDDITVADLVADFRAATPTAAIVALLPSKNEYIIHCQERKNRLREQCFWIIRKEKDYLLRKSLLIDNFKPLNVINSYKESLLNRRKLLNALSPKASISRGFAIVTNNLGKSIISIRDADVKENLLIELGDGFLDVNVVKITQKGD